jgi:hypothetical protein
MAVTILASFVLRMLSTYLTVRSIMLRSILLRALNQMPRRRACFLISESLLKEGADAAASLTSGFALPMRSVKRGIANLPLFPLTPYPNTACYQ